MPRRLTLVFSFMVLAACSGGPGTAAADVAPLLERLEETGLPALSAEELGCVSSSIDLPRRRLVELHADPPQYRDLSVALSVAGSYLACGAQDAVREKVRSDFKDTSSECADLLDADALGKVVASVLVEDEHRVFTAIQPYVRCVQAEELGATREGRVILAFSTTSFARLVDGPTAACIAADLEKGQADLAGVEAALSGDLGNPAAVYSVSASLVECLDPGDLAAVVVSTTGADLSCVEGLLVSEPGTIVELVTAYLLQDASAGQAMVGSIRAACGQR